MRATAAVLLVGLIVAGSACDDSSDSNGASTLAPIVPVSAVTAPPERSSPFCTGIADLNRRLEESSDNQAALIVAAYTELLPYVPVELGVDFRQVIADLEAGNGIELPSAPDDTLTTAPPTSSLPGTAPATTAEVFEEGYDPDDTAAGRVNAYIQFACTGGRNNPGPPATQPDTVTTPSTG